ncbi:c-type cytochrome [Flavobacterium sp.]|jgi:cytochrome c|uniref:c-type cytochrome n=1 Tax=Flavobacterium sp. TaxID=239 RepID=UPI0037C148E0
MNKSIILIAFFLLISCNNKDEKTQISVDKTATKISGKELFEGEGNCIACHQPEQKIIGPSIQEIATIYKDKNASIVSFLREESEPIVDPSQYEIMKTNFAITKSMSDEELKALEDYFFSFPK